MSQAYTFARSTTRAMVDEMNNEVRAVYPPQMQVIIERLALTDKLVELLQEFAPAYPMPPKMRDKFMLMMEELS
jgi:hypothetical protein